MLFYIIFENTASDAEALSAERALLPRLVDLGRISNESAERVSANTSNRALPIFFEKFLIF